jgi:elongation factor G
VIVVVEPETEKMVAVTPFLYFLDRHKIPHLILINKMDQNTTPVRDLMAALQTISSRPLVLRQVPLRDGEAITGYIDLVSERAYRFQPGAASALIEIPASAAARGADARNTLLETIADFDDVILEQLLDDQRPDNSAVYENFTATLTADALVPVLLGAGLLDHGVQRLLKMLRHDTPAADAAAQRAALIWSMRLLLRFLRLCMWRIRGNFLWSGCGAASRATACS